MKLTKWILILIAMALSGCSINQSVEPAELDKGDRLCVVEDVDVRPGFLGEIKKFLAERRIPYDIVQNDAIPVSCEWTMRYVGRWTWDMSLYMSYAEIKIYKNGQLDGSAVYDSTGGGANMNKFIDAEPKIRELLDQLITIKSAFLGNIIG